MPKAKIPSLVTLIAQIQSISVQVDEASNALKELQVHMGNLDSSRKQIFDAIAARNAKTAELLSKASKARDQSSILTELGAFEKSTAVSLLKLQKGMQREGQITTAVSNALKIKHDKIKNTISNIH